MTEVGFIPLAIALTIIAFLTDTVLLLPVIAFIQFVTVVTNVLQVTSKKFRGKKIFLVAPIHHHFEALGWPPYKVVMRYWVLFCYLRDDGSAHCIVGVGKGKPDYLTGWQFLLSEFFLLLTQFFVQVQSST